MTLIHLSIAWIVGIALAGWLKPPWPVPALLLGALVLFLLIWWCRARARFFLWLVLLATLGALRWELARPSFDARDVAFYAEQAVELQGVVAGESEESSGGVSFLCQVESLRLPGQGWGQVHGRVLVQAPPFLLVAYGDRLLLSGVLAVPKSSPGFSYRDYLARQGIYVLLEKVGTVQPLPGHGGSFFARALAEVRAWARARLETLLPEPESSLLVGILLGSRTSIPATVQEAFSRSGTSHILAISGWNINIVAAFLAALGKRLPRRTSFALVLSGILLYTLLVGAGAAVLRAALMGVLYVIAQQAGRPGHALTALLASAWAMTLWNPGLLWDLSFQLSFAATLGMLLFVPAWTSAWPRCPAMLSESLAATLSSQLVTWPLIALYFRQFSLVVPLANLLACPALAPLMLLGALALLLRGVPLLGPFLRALTWFVAAYMLAVVGWAGGLSWAAVPMPGLGVLFLFGYYGALGWWWYRWRGGECTTKGTVSQ